MGDRGSASTQEPMALISTEIREQHEAWRSFLAGLTPEQAARPVHGPWSAIDGLVHVTAWIENGLRVAHRQAQPGEPDPGPHRGPAGYLHIHVDQFNADVFHAHQGWALERVLAWSDRINGELLEALAALPTERSLGGAGRYGARMWYWMPAFIHSRGHRRRIMRLLLGEGDK